MQVHQDLKTNIRNLHFLFRQILNCKELQVEKAFKLEKNSAYEDKSQGLENQLKNESWDRLND